MTDQITANRASQTELYGETLSAVLADVSAVLGLNQAQLADAIGISAAMLSHLVGGRRVKIGNPVAHARLGQLRILAGNVRAGQVSADEAAAAIRRIASTVDSWGTTETAVAPRAPDDTETVRQVQDLFRSTASAADWLEVAGSVEADHPEIAELLRSYGAARTSTAVQHWRRALRPT